MTTMANTEIDNVIKHACDLVDSIIPSSNYNIPKEMTYSINKLQDAVYEYLTKMGEKLCDNLTPEYVKFRNDVRNERRRSIYAKQLKDDDTIECPMCKKVIAWDEFANNCYMCESCFKEWSKDDVEKD